MGRRRDVPTKGASMTLSTSIRIADPVNPELVFLKAREIIGIPAEHPFTIGDKGLGWDNGVWIASRPDGFRSALDVSHAHGDLLIDECDEYCDTPCDHHAKQPPAYVDVRLDTTYGFRGPNGETCGDVHREVCARLGAWLDEQGLDWWAMDEYTGEWHHRTPCPIDRDNDRAAADFTRTALRAVMRESQP